MKLANDELIVCEGCSTCRGPATSTTVSSLISFALIAEASISASWTLDLGRAVVMPCCCKKRKLKTAMAWSLMDTFSKNSASNVPLKNLPCTSSHASGESSRWKSGVKWLNKAAIS